MNVLVIQTAFLGDLAITLPFIDAIDRTIAPEKIFLVAQPFAADLLYGTKYEDNVIVYDKKGDDAGIGGFLTAAFKIRRAGVSIVFCPHLSIRSAALSLLSGATERRGFEKNACKTVFNRRFEYEFYGGSHYIDKLMRLLPECSDVPDFRFNFSYDTISEEEAAGLIPRTRPAVGLGIGSAWDIKCLPEGKWAVLAEKLASAGYAPVLLGTDRDRIRAGKIIHLMKSNKGEVTDLTGRTDVPLLKSVLKRMKLVYSNDNALVHLSSLIGVPVVGIYGPTARTLGFYPKGEKSAVAELNISCRPCGLHGARKCVTGKLECMEIDPEKIFQLGRALISG